jgi:2,3-bisphosphoglycerate-dependent phosphoglycerate mutase
MKLYLIRHATPSVAEYSGFPGPALGKKGKQEAQRVCTFLENKAITQVFSSDYLRVQQTLAPFRTLFPSLHYTEAEALREREKESESHESLVKRVHTWFKNYQRQILSENTAIFGHCGSLNMILEYIDPKKEVLDYPHEDKYGCLTPLSGIWVLEFALSGHLRKGKLFLPK